MRRLVLVLALLVGACTGAVEEPTTTEDADTTSVPTSTLAESTTTTGVPTTETIGAVMVTIEGVEGALGWQLAGILYMTPRVGFYNQAVGGFAATVDTDPFTTTQLVHQAVDHLVGPFPFVTEMVLSVEPGTYELIIWLGRTLQPYSRWVPADEAGLVACWTVVEVEQGKDTTVTVTGGLAPVGEGVPDCLLSAS